jgi:RNA polymerase sigma-70 factor (ECF subfamily)
MTRTDEELVARATAGDLDSFNQLMSRWERPIYALAYRMMGREEDARDVVQEAFLRAFRELRGFKGAGEILVMALPDTPESVSRLVAARRRAPIVQVRKAPIRCSWRRSGSADHGSVEDLVARRENHSGGQGDGQLPEQRTAIMLKNTRPDVSGDRGHARCR